MKQIVSKTFILLAFSMTSNSFAGGLLPETPARLDAGKTLYTQNCKSCHGDNGDGNGPAGKLMKPKPRDFKGAKFVNGDKPADIFKTIGEGLSGTAMPPFKTLTDEEKSSIAHYVLKLKSGK